MGWHRTPYSLSLNAEETVSNLQGFSYPAEFDQTINAWGSLKKKIWVLTS